MKTHLIEDKNYTATAARTHLRLQVIEFLVDTLSAALRPLAVPAPAQAIRRVRTIAVARAHRNISVSVPVDLAERLDHWTAEDGTSRSGLVTRLLDEERRRRFDAELEQAYRELTEDGFYDDIEFYLPAQAEVALAEPWEWEPEAR